ncbi:uncharacterized protein K452DRAFT_118487 [Aplosporella prunicola CBS 121167]|uniref:Thioesterase domain-containing protein n=1 Tax=Aplosporella prunicola CBS 121167 TaxID=1176127 RepID=A0A6A6BMH3_9PEZI|nr:uncharacterized protein K452DRAFT_118487 [Aplosporella prunicola CBS 121167]KAF2145330.1 hypothetical protein K452DRAFT_118487 [Aplosporella prunicola CBS 121167]
MPSSAAATAAAARRLSLYKRPAVRCPPCFVRRPITPLARRFLGSVADSTTSTLPSPSASATASPTHPPPKKSLPRRLTSFLALSALFFTLGTAMAAAPAVAVAQDLMHPPTDAETLTLYAPEPNTPAGTLEAELQALPLVAALRADNGLVEGRPHMKIPPALRENNFTGGTLLGHDMLGVPPLAFVAPDGSRLVALHHLGPALCGHPGIVHGGLLATLLDEGLARCCFPALPNKVGLTASLNISYKAPCRAGQWVVLRAETTKVEGRKAWVRGRLESIPNEGEEPVVMVEAEALFIEPRQAKVSFSLLRPPFLGSGVVC